MQVPDTPPEVEEGEVSGDVGVVRLTAVARRMAAIVNNRAASTAPPWTTATVPRWAAATMDRDPGACVPDLRPLTLLSSPNHCLRATTATPASLRLSTIFSFRLRSRKPRAS